MTLTDREFWGLIHGMVFGAVFLLAYAGGLAELWALRPEFATAQGILRRTKRLMIGTWVMAAAAWGTVLTGTWIVYPWYRAEGGAKTALLASPSTEGWHTFGIEWKEHLAWVAPLLATAVAFIVTYYRKDLAKLTGLRHALLVTFTAAFGIAGVAGLLGALITKSAPVL